MPTQLRLPLKPSFSHGGARRGAGRPNRSGHLAHTRRPRLDPRHPVHVTIKLSPGLPSLRRKDVFRCFRHAVRNARKKGLRVIHFAILSNHAHFLIEPEGASLARPMQSLGISFAKRLKAVSAAPNAVFAGRYHLRTLKTPSEAKRVLAYVLSNEAKHRGTREIRPKIKIDPFSSALRFEEWEKLFRKPRVLWTNWAEQSIENWLDEILSLPRTWLLKSGWQRESTEL